MPGQRVATSAAGSCKHCSGAKLRSLFMTRSSADAGRASSSRQGRTRARTGAM